MSVKTLTDSIVKLTGDVWGDLVSYTPFGGAPISIKGIFKHDWVDIEGVVTLKPTLRIAVADLSSNPAKGDAVVIATVNYKVSESRLDGFGGSTLILQKA